MIIFRPHRASLDDAMAEKAIFDTVEEMRRYIINNHSNEYYSDEDIEIGEIMGDDDRIGWKNYRHVCVKRFGKEDYIKKYGVAQCIGMCSLDYENRSH